MKHAALLLLALTAAASAQVQLGLRVRPDVALQYEPVDVEFTIRNNVGEPLDSSSDGNCRIDFLVRGQAGIPAPRVKTAKAPAPVLVPPAQMLTFRDTLAGRYDLSACGAYTVQMRVELGDYAFTSEKQYVDVVPGIEVGSLSAMVPGGSRQYRLLLVNREKHDRLFLRIDDAKLCYGVFDLGRIVRMTPPEIRADGAGLVHVLHQSSPQQFTYSTYNSQGERKEQRQVGGSTVRVALATDGSGAVALEEIPVYSQDEIKALDSLSSGVDHGTMMDNRQGSRRSR
jgi:hypothetical protein